MGDGVWEELRQCLSRRRELPSPKEMDIAADETSFHHSHSHINELGPPTIRLGSMLTAQLLCTGALLLDTVRRQSAQKKQMRTISMLLSYDDSIFGILKKTVNSHHVTCLWPEGSKLPRQQVGPHRFRSAVAGQRRRRRSITRTFSNNS